MTSFLLLVALAGPGETLPVAWADEPPMAWCEEPVATWRCCTTCSDLCVCGCKSGGPCKCVVVPAALSPVRIVVPMRGASGCGT